MFLFPYMGKRARTYAAAGLILLGILGILLNSPYNSHRFPLSY
ncbi:MAG: hypothetical protein ACJAW0_000001 [Zhongshania sp.]|jgi:hypothetical protein